MQKIVYLLWTEANEDAGNLRRSLLERCATRILQLNVQQLQINIADEFANCPSPALKIADRNPVRAQLNVWLDDPSVRSAIEAILRSEHFHLAAYLVRESIYSDYGDNRHATARDWPDGQRSPGILALTLLKKPDHLNHDDWMQRWHGRQSPLSEAMQPRTRYVRNVVEQSLTPDAPDYQGFVEECWPSFQHVTNKFLFFGARNAFQFLWHLLRMMRSVTSFLQLPSIRTYMMSEYFLKSDNRPNRMRRIHG